MEDTKETMPSKHRRHEAHINSQAHWGSIHRACTGLGLMSPRAERGSELKPTSLTQDVCLIDILIFYCAYVLIKITHAPKGMSV